ncbi:hypothetical protein F164LOC_18290 [Pectobacterium carotovorum]|uniref:type IV pilus biogenesis protein PilM n=1 Tax=Pectobacterium versatile TaxID=2488639 RepID=UPI000C7E96F8|nr:type IV pilus biogenesis protein PilM [Pectobacterium versatile]PLY35845.1 hypothetical protein F164LOC_18290 [Pectobacterium carotovorum]
MNSPAITGAFAFFAIASALTITSMNSRSDVFEQAKVKTSATTFILYSDVFARYINANPVQGEVKISSLNGYYPAWLTARTDIRAFYINGTGYVFMQDEKGMMRELNEKTYNSKNIGLTNDGLLVTPKGNVTKPSFIPDGYVVYLL